ncbi:MAG: hypothetical protein JSW10_04745 [Pseudomonadota bacterium]|nr:MAG: hypothetical protein JSW10_04745 [Pseudomonadota bacterium]
MNTSESDRKATQPAIAAHRIYLALALIATTMAVAPALQAGPFNKGSVRLSVLLGRGQAFNNNYTILGAGGGYYVIDGLELGADYEAWLNGDPDIQKLTPQVRYVFHRVPKVKPYAGLFYRRTFVDGFDDTDSWGGRAGVFFGVGARVYFGAGLVYDRVRDCDEGVYVSCSDTYPELSVGFAL